MAYRFSAQSRAADHAEVSDRRYRGVLSVVSGDPYVAMSGIPLLLCAGGYVVFFPGPRLHVAHVLWCVASVLGVAVWLVMSAPEGGVLVAASRSIIALLVTVCVLPILQFGFWLLQDSSMQSLTDPLTELTNRRGLGVSLQRLDAAQTACAPVCVILIDVDGFKAINDTRGHAVGDDVLIRTAQRIRASVRREAVVVRWGGEEFLVVDRVEAGEAFAIAERIRREVAQQGDPSVTVSVGIASEDAGNPGIDRLVAAADAAMYDAKRSGGNCVVTSGAR